MARTAVLIYVLAALAPLTALAQQAPDAGTVPEVPTGLNEPGHPAPLGSVQVQAGQVVLSSGSGAPRVVQIGCVARAAVAVGTTLTVACTDGVVRELTVAADGTLTPGASRAVGAEVRGLFVRDGRVWLEYARVEAEPVENFSPVAVASATAVATPATTSLGSAGEATAAAQAATAHGEVLSVDGTDVIVSLGRDQGLRGDNHVEIGGTDAANQEAIATTVVGRVRDVGADRAVIAIGFGEVVQVGDGVRTTTRPTTSDFVAPQRSAGVLSIGGDVRAVVPIGGLGLGTLTDLWAEWHARIPFALRVRVLPLAGLYFNQQTSSGGFPPSTSSVERVGGLFGASVDAMYDSRLFAIGLGLGVGQYSRNVYFTSGYYGTDVGFGFAITQVLRIGSLDGFNFSVQNSVLVIDSAFQYGGTDGHFQIPITSTWSLIIRGGGSVAPYGFTELGIRIALRGGGGAGTLFVTPAIGWAGIGVRTTTSSPGMPGYSSETFVVGPSVGVGLEYRLGV